MVGGQFGGNLLGAREVAEVGDGVRPRGVRAAPQGIGLQEKDRVSKEFLIYTTVNEKL